MKIFFLASLGIASFFPGFGEDCSSLFQDLQIVRQVDREIADRLPLFYNSSLVAGYFVTPSARFPKNGELAIGAASVSPYWVYSANFAVFSRIELSANYRVFDGILEGNFGHEGFGDDADRVGNVKFGVLVPEDGIPFLPSIAYGLDDVIGSKRFSSQYVVATKVWKDHNVEVSLGYGSGRIKGVFGGIAWTPFRDTQFPVLKNLSLFAEYDPNDYKHHPYEHKKGRKIASRINGGAHWILADTLQLSVSSVRGKKIGGSVSLRFPLGSTQGLVPKIDDPCIYTTPVDTEPIGSAGPIMRPEREFICDLACQFADQGLDLYDAYLLCNGQIEKELHLKVVNNRYRKELEVRDRIQALLSALLPSNIARVKVVIEADGVSSHSYSFRACDLFCFQDCQLSSWELAILSPMKEVGCSVDPYEVDTLFQRGRQIWTLTLRPRTVAFFGSTSGKFKYSLGILASFEGFLPGGLTYRFQGSYAAFSSVKGLTNRDRLNPSELPHVRTDAVKYYQEGRARLEELFLQKAWNLGRGWFFRLSGGYFEPAYGGGATELLFYPVRSNWAIGADTSLVWKREFTGLGFVNKATRFNSKGEEEKVPFTGVQAFVNLYYDFKPLDLLFELKAGQFLAKDRGARFQVTRYFESGAQFSLWLTLTNGGDRVNGKTYYDKGFAFAIPFDIFLKKSSRSFLTYAMSAWLRDVGAIAASGKPLYPLLYEERCD